MPMNAMVASGSITGLSGIAAGAPTLLITSATNMRAGTNTYNETGLYAVAWSYSTQGATGSAVGTIAVPCFTWWDAAQATSITATGGAIGFLLGAGSATALSGQASGTFGFSTSAASAQIRGFEVFEAASGGSGVSAYIQVSSLGAGGRAVRFDYKVLRLDDWGV